MIIIKDMAQGSKEWLELRLGVVTASGVKQLFRFGEKSGWRHDECATWHANEATALKCRKGMSVPEYREALTVTLSAQRDKYRNQLLAEWVTGEPVDEFYGTYWTERGKELEGEAADYFSLQTDLNVEACAFIFRDDSRTAGSSPDMLVVDSNGEVVAGLELKCPNAATHVGYLLDGRDAYEEQVQMSLWASQLPAWWFMSYHPALPPYLECVKPVADYQSAFDEHLPEFLKEVEEGKDKLRVMGAADHLVG